MKPVALLQEVVRSDGLKYRALRSSFWAAFAYGGSQALRLASNLILTRLLFPEAFGMMALVTVFMVGLAMFSDVGLGPSIMGSKRGDDRAFLDTAWTLQIIRGVLLALCCWGLAGPVAAFYGEPMLANLLPVAGVALLIGGFNPTALETANRHLMIGRVMLADFAGQILGIVVMVALAWATGSVWALVVGGVVSAVGKLCFSHLLLTNTRNRLRWEPAAVSELIHFGKWIFLSTAFGFFMAQGDKALLGRFLSLEMLGIYQVGFFIASFPLLLTHAITTRLLIPLYRSLPPGETPANFRKIRMMRIALTGAAMSMQLTMAFIGVPLVAILYDPRYAAAGAIIVLIAAAETPRIVINTYDQVALAAGDSRSYFFVLAARATAQIGLFAAGLVTFGLVGAIAGQMLSVLLTYPLIVWLARRHKAWDAAHDAIFGGIGLTVAALALWVNRAEILTLME